MSKGNVKQFLKFSMFVLLVLNMYGCAKSPQNYRPVIANFSSPDVGVVVEAGLGETLLTQGMAVNREIITILKEVDWTFSGITVPTGNYAKTGEDHKYIYFSPLSTQNVWTTYDLFSRPMTGGSILVRKRDNMFCVTNGVDTFCDEDELYKLDKENVLTKDSYQQTLIYSGRVANKLRMSYREFSNDIARAAFSVDVEYDLNDGDVIGYKGAKLKIIESSNTSIKYKVIENFK